MKAWSKGLCCWLAIGAGAACSTVTEVTTTDLVQVVQRDGVAFTGDQIPPALIDRLAQHQLVVVGETHGLQEHAEFMTALLTALHGRGFRHLLMEWPQAADWILADFVNGGRLEPEWDPPRTLNGGLIQGIRRFNATQPEDQRITVRGIDVNLSDYGGADSFRDLLRTLVGHLGEPGPVTAFLQSEYDTAEEQEGSLQNLRIALDTRQSALRAEWGPEPYELVTEMVEVEGASVAVRANREDHYDLSVRLRESVMKRLTDMRLEGHTHRSVLNVGGNHAQKAHLKGTSQEWLGDYLVHESSVVGGSAFVVGFVPARTAPGTGGFASFDILDRSPENELFRVMEATWPEQTVFLPLDDPVFRAGGLPVNFEGTIYVCALQEQYDAVVLYPMVHRVVDAPRP